MFMRSVVFFYCYAECTYTECRYADCRGAKFLLFNLKFPPLFLAEKILENFDFPVFVVQVVFAQNAGK